RRRPAAAVLGLRERDGRPKKGGDRQGRDQCNERTHRRPFLAGSAVDGAHHDRSDNRPTFPVPERSSPDRRAGRSRSRYSAPRGRANRNSPRDHGFLSPPLASFASLSPPLSPALSPLSDASAPPEDPDPPAGAAGGVGGGGGWFAMFLMKSSICLMTL